MDHWVRIRQLPKMYDTPLVELTQQVGMLKYGPQRCRASVTVPGTEEGFQIAFANLGPIWPQSAERKDGADYRSKQHVFILSKWHGVQHQIVYGWYIHHHDFGSQYEILDYIGAWTTETDLADPENPRLKRISWEPLRPVESE